MPTIQIDDSGSVLHYADSGPPSKSCKTVILLHGFSFNGLTFRGLLESASKYNLRIVAVNRRMFVFIFMLGLTIDYRRISRIYTNSTRRGYTMDFSRCFYQGSGAVLRYQSSRIVQISGDIHPGKWHTGYCLDRPFIRYSKSKFDWVV